MFYVVISETAVSFRSNENKKLSVYRFLSLLFHVCNVVEEFSFYNICVVSSIYFNYKSLFRFQVSVHEHSGTTNISSYFLGRASVRVFPTTPLLKSIF